MTPPDESQFLKLSVAGSLKKKNNFQAFLILIINLVKQNEQNRVFFLNAYEFTLVTIILYKCDNNITNVWYTLVLTC